MDSRIFLGGSEPTTLKELNQSLGKETIDTYNTGESRGRETSHSLNYQKLGKILLQLMNWLCWMVANVFCRCEVCGHSFQISTT